MSEQVRAWIYLVVTLILVLLLVLGIVSGEEVDRYLALIATALGGGTAALAAANTSRKTSD
jgi:hypothetical protein